MDNIDNVKILENKSNYLIVKENNLIKLFSYRSLVAICNTDLKTLEEIPYKFLNINGITKTHSMTTARHINKFIKFLTKNDYIYNF